MRNRPSSFGSGIFRGLLACGAASLVAQLKSQTVLSGIYPGVTSFSGAVSVNTNANITGSMTLAGAATTFGNNAYLYLTSTNATLTIDSASTATGDIRILADGSTGTVLTNQGIINHTDASTGELYARTFNNSGSITTTSNALAIGTTTTGYNTFNSGTITANGSGAIIDVDGNVANTGTLSALNSGVLLFRGANTSANLGTVQLTTGGRALLNGTLTTTTLNPPASGIYELYGGTITGGTVASNALTFTSSSGTLNGTTLAGTVAIPANTNASIAGSTSFAGAAATFGNNAYLYLNNASAALTIDSASTATGDIRIIADGGTGTVLTNQGAITHTDASSGELYARTFNNSGTITTTANALAIGTTTAGYNTFNTGTITANGSGAIIDIDGNVANTGTLSALNSGVLLFRGANTSANLGTVQLTTGGRALLNGTLTTTTLNPPAAGIYELYGGTITGGTVASNALTFTSSSGTLNSTTLAGTVTIPANTNASIAGSTSLAGAAATFGTNAYLYLNNTNAALTIDSASTVTGDIRIIADGSTGTVLTNQGIINHTHASTGELYARTFNNSGTITTTANALAIGTTTAGYNTFNTGTITANGSGAIIDVDGNVANTGILRALNSGQLLFRGANTSANLGTVQLTTGGRALLNGTLTTTTLNPPATGIYELFGGTITGGTVASNALTFTSTGGTLNGTSLAGTVTIPANTNASIAGSTSLTGAAATFGTNAYLYLNNASAALTIDPASTVTGDIRIIADGSTGTALTNQGAITHTHASSGELYARTFTNLGSITTTANALAIGTTTTGYNTFNSGTITADGTGAIIYVDGNVANAGNLRAQNSGQLVFRGTNTTGNLGTVQLATGGRAILFGTLNNTAALLSAPTGGFFEVPGSTIIGGTIASGAISITSSGALFSGVTLNGDFGLGAGLYATVTGGTTFTGANGTFTTSSGIHWQQVGTLAGKALSMANGSYVYIEGANSALTLDAATTATGDVSIYSDGSAGTAITNLGALTHSIGTGDLYARSFTNSNLITANASTLNIGSTTAGYNTANTGTITANGSGTIVNLNGNVTNTGTLIAENSGHLVFNGTNSSGNLGTIQIATGGHVYLNGTLNNTTFGAPTGGVLELRGGTIVGGTVAASALGFTSSAGTLNGATLTGDLAVGASTRVDFTGGATFTGANATFGASAGSYWQQVGTLAGKALGMANGSYLYVSGVNSALTLDAATTVTGDVSIYSDGSAGTAITNLGTLTHSIGTGNLYARTFTNSNLITANASTLNMGSTTAGYNTANTGTITANGSGTIVNLNGNVTNTGTLIAENSGHLVFNGTNSSGNLGTIQIATGGHVYLNGTLNNTTFSAPTGGVLELRGGTIVGGTVAASALGFTSSAGTLNGAILTGDLAVGANTRVDFTGGATFTGANATFGASAGSYWQQADTLAGKAISMANGSYFYVSGVNSALTLDAATTATGDVSIYSDGSAGTAITNLGTLTHSIGTGNLYARTFTNSNLITANASTLNIGSTTAGYNTANTGTITANGSGTIVNLNGNVTNTGTLIAENSGHLVFNGTNSSGNLGTIQIATGGHVYLNGTLNNTTFSAPTGGVLELRGGTIVGGTVAASALGFTSSAGTLNGAILTGDLAVGASTRVDFTGGATFTGANATFGASAGSYWQQVGTLAGKALGMANGSYFYVSGVNSALTLDAATTATGDVSIYSDGSAGTAITNLGALTHSIGTGDLYARSFTNSNLITANASTLNIGSTTAGYNTANTGTITANGSGTIVNLNGNVTNTGTLIAENSGHLVFNGTNSSGNLGTIQIATGGHVYLNGTLNNTTFGAPTGGVLELRGGTIVGGTVAASALGFTSSGGTLNGAILTGDLAVGANTRVDFTGGATFTGANATFGASAGSYWQQVGTLAGKALGMANGSYFYVSGVNSALTLDAATTATGDVSIYSDGSAGTAITNQGSLTHSIGTGNLYARTFANSGAITATAGTLNLGTSASGYSFVNNPGGTITVAGGSVTLNAAVANPIVNNGLINVQSGTLFTGNHLTNGATGLIGGSGIVNGGLTVAGGTLSPGNSIGALTFAGGTLTVTQPATYALEIGGAASDELVFQNPTSAVNIGTGLLTLSLTLLSAPAEFHTFNVIRISSGGSGITGTFANLPVSGAVLSASFLSTPYLFFVNYQPNAITLASIPEPGTYALLGVGLAVFIFARRRARR